MNNVITISAKEWMGCTTNNSISSVSGLSSQKQKEDGNYIYIESAVNLACVLTKHLLEIISAVLAASVDISNVKLNDKISIDNVLIFVERRGTSTSLVDAHYGPSSEVKRVKFLFEGAIPLSSVSVLQHATDNITTPVASKGAEASAVTVNTHLRAVCVSLGKILLEIFSRGRSSTPMASVSFSNGSTSKNNNGNDDDDDVTMMPSVNKRMAAVSIINGSIVSDMAKLLLDMGVPISICRLVCDLLEATTKNIGSSCSCPSTYITLEQALFDLTQMKNDPRMFLFDRTCPKKALDDTSLFTSTGQLLFGRGKEIDALMKAKNSVSSHVNVNISNIQRGAGSSCTRFLCEAVFLAGYAGSGKSCLLRSLVETCQEEQCWFILKCKFDKQAVPLMIMANAFNDFFEKWGGSPAFTPTPTGGIDAHSYRDPSMMKSFQQIYNYIFSTFDDEAFFQLCELIPNISRLFPLGTGLRVNTNQCSSSTGTVGSAEKRLAYLLNVLFKAFCSAGHPVLIILDDLQWSDSLVISCMVDFIGDGESTATDRQGCLIAGSYRSNEVKESDDLIQNINLIKHSGKANVTELKVGGLTEGDITHLISTKLGLPSRYTRELAQLVHHKSRGNPFHIIQFLKSIIQNKMLKFSVRSRRWEWDCDTIDMQMISNGVAELLTSTFNRLPANLMNTLKIVSCFGNQIEESTIDQMNSTQKVLPFDMHHELELAVKEGLLEKAGPIYAFSHDLIHQTLYDLIPSENRRLLHRSIGKGLLESDDDNQTRHLLGVDQINLFCKDGNPRPEERSKFAEANVAAAKFAIATSSFVKAQSYVDMGIRLLDTGHWEQQYSLSMNLFEMSASLCYMRGDTTVMSSCLDEILSHSKSFEDSLEASVLLAKLLSSSSKHDEAITNCLAILMQLGEEFPPRADLATILDTLSKIQPLLMTLSVGQMKSLPSMTDKTKLQAMKFLSMLCTLSVTCSPRFLPLLSVRMMTLTLEYGMCHDSIIGVIMTAYSIFLFREADTQLAHHVGKVGEYLREESPNKHLLRSRLSPVWEGSLHVMREPIQAIVSMYPSLFESAMLAGDVENAMLCRWLHCCISLYAGDDLAALSKHFLICIKQSANYQQHDILHITMATYQAFVQVSGNGNTDKIKSFDELNEIGEPNSRLLFHVFMNQLFVHFWFRDYIALTKLCKRYPQSNDRRVLFVMRCFFEGIASLNIARQSGQLKWRIIGEEAVKRISELEVNSRWNFENKSKLLQAELHYLNRDCKSAEDAYKASIKSAHEHKFIHEEALAYELFGIFCIENQMANKGSKHLRIALDKYKQWGAMKKCKDLERFIDVVNPTAL